MFCCLISEAFKNQSMFTQKNFFFFKKFLLRKTKYYLLVFLYLSEWSDYPRRGVEQEYNTITNHMWLFCASVCTRNHNLTGIELEPQLSTCSCIMCISIWRKWNQRTKYIFNQALSRAYVPLYTDCLYRTMKVSLFFFFLHGQKLIRSLTWSLHLFYLFIFVCAFRL